MSRYYTFNAADAVEYARQFGGVDDPLSLITADEIGDGNLNLVFKIRDTQGISRVIVKQALPYVRCVGESWPLTIDRSRIEAETLIVHYEHCPQHTARVIHHDPELAVMVQEDLSDYEIWRGELVKGKYYPQAASQLGEYLAQSLFHTSDLYQNAEHKKSEVGRFLNPELCLITEDLFFTDPYIEHERNCYDAALQPTVDELRADIPLRIAVGDLKQRFLSNAEALLHGDVHSGSIFVAEGRLKVIDAEFGFYGPIGFDPGSAMGNLLLNYCGLPGLVATREAADGREQRLQDLRDLWLSFSERFLQLARDKTQDQAFKIPGYAEHYLKHIWHDAVGYCGSELIRRTIGFSNVADLKNIADQEMRHECQRHALSLGQWLIITAPQIDDIEGLIARIRQNG
ncbi:S-methyl-5-thioribose kinase [Serratia sp. M24T3]|uniref:S-methyl-5-thioribose kinase n=1 Tax=Serratia sp. M24T3 TaxID=932213 RepID=UPI00025BAE61|nr:S-methyl-5-thioribose kinase [Serratia sp. M24T3]EIC83263.1 methylthioribose kinase [Serratia sp. M24T3]